MCCWFFRSFLWNFLHCAMVFRFPNIKTPLRYIIPDTDPPLFNLFLFFEVGKENKDTHPLMTHPPMFLSGHRVRISIFNELPDTEMTASTKWSQQWYDHWYKWTYNCSILMKSRSLHSSTKKGFMIIFTVKLRPFMKYHSPLFSVTQLFSITENTETPPPTPTRDVIIEQSRVWKKMSRKIQSSKNEIISKHFKQCVKRLCGTTFMVFLTMLSFRAHFNDRIACQ